MLLEGENLLLVSLSIYFACPEAIGGIRPAAWNRGAAEVAPEQAHLAFP